MVALVYLLTDDRMLQRGSVEPGHLPILAGIAAALETLGSRERQPSLTLDAKAIIALVRATAALVCAARGSTDASAIEPARGSTGALSGEP